MKYIFLSLISLVAINAGALDVESIIKRMDADGRSTAIGKDSSAGHYVICRAEAEIGSDINLSREQAKLNARTAIAELFAVKVSGDSTEETESKESVKDDTESFEMNEFRKSVVRKDINQVQRGISVCKETKSATKIILYCILTERVMDATAELEKAMKELGPDTVRVSGVGYFNELVTEDKAHANAVGEAQRNAIAEVMGMSMTSSSARQTISSETVDNNGDETFACDDSFKCRTFCASAGFIESSRVVDEKKTEDAICVTIVAKVARGKLMDDYRAYLESMGNPGFCVRSNDSDLFTAASDFFAELGLCMANNISEAAYIIDAIGRGDGGTATVTVTMRDKIARTVLFSATASAPARASASAAYLAALNSIKTKLHQGIDKFISRANADGRKVTVRFCNYDSEYKSVIEVVKTALENVPGAKNVRKGTAKLETIEFTLNYTGDARDLADFLEAHIKTDVKRRRHRPELGRVENTLVEFNFE